MKKECQKFMRHLKKIGVPYKVRIEFVRAWRSQCFLSLDNVCDILDKCGIKHDLINVSWDDLERYGCKHYQGAWLNEQRPSYLHTEKFDLIFGRDFSY